MTHWKHDVHSVSRATTAKNGGSCDPVSLEDRTGSALPPLRQKKTTERTQDGSPTHMERKQSGTKGAVSASSTQKTFSRDLQTDFLLHFLQKCSLAALVARAAQPNRDPVAKTWLQHAAHHECQPCHQSKNCFPVKRASAALSKLKGTFQW